MDQNKGTVIYEDPQYFSAFARLQTEGEDLFQLRGNNLIIEKLEESERRTQGGLILAQDSNQVRDSMQENAAVIGLVLLSGPGVVIDEDTTQDNDIKPGMLVMIPRYSIEYYTTFPGLHNLTKNRIGRVDASEVKFLYKDITSFQKAQELLNS